jgi:hypothetical protein
LEVEPPDCGNDRRRDNFAPLWRIAQALGDPWPERIAAAYAVTETGDDEDNEPAHVLLLRDVLAVFEAKRTTELSPTDLIAELVLMEDRPWSDWKNGRPLSPHTLGRMLKSFRLKAIARKVYGKAARVFTKTDIYNAAVPYLAEKRNLVTLQHKQEVTPIPERNHEPEVTFQKSANPLKKRTVTRLRFRPPGGGLEGKGRRHEQPGGMGMRPGQPLADIIFDAIAPGIAGAYAIAADHDDADLRKALAALSVLRGPGTVARDVAIALIRDELQHREGQ